MSTRLHLCCKVYDEQLHLLRDAANRPTGSLFQVASRVKGINVHYLFCAKVHKVVQGSEESSVLKGEIAHKVEAFLTDVTLLASVPSKESVHEFQHYESFGKPIIIYNSLNKIPMRMELSTLVDSTKGKQAQKLYVLATTFGVGQWDRLIEAVRKRFEIPDHAAQAFRDTMAMPVPEQTFTLPPHFRACFFMEYGENTYVFTSDLTHMVGDKDGGCTWLHMVDMRPEWMADREQARIRRREQGGLIDGHPTFRLVPEDFGLCLSELMSLFKWFPELPVKQAEIDQGMLNSMSLSPEALERFVTTEPIVDRAMQVIVDFHELSTLIYSEHDNRKVATELSQSLQWVQELASGVHDCDGSVESTNELMSRLTHALKDSNIDYLALNLGEATFEVVTWLMAVLKDSRKEARRWKRKAKQINT